MTSSGKSLMGMEATKAGCSLCYRNDSYALHTAKLFYAKKKKKRKKEQERKKAKGKIQKIQR